MADDLKFGVTFAAALGCGMIGGVFFAFSSFVMAGLSRLPPEQGIAAMQSINVTVINRWFMGVFVGTGLACLLLAIGSLFQLRETAARLRLLGCLVYLLGSIVVTIGFNVPRNDVLAAVEAPSAEGAAEWAQYVPGWTDWNTVRAIASVVAAALLFAALLAEQGDAAS
ncbi:MAG: DUF1772 domain-containing protein [Thermomicrobiales bacterium]